MDLTLRKKNLKEKNFFFVVKSRFEKKYMRFWGKSFNVNVNVSKITLILPKDFPHTPTSGPRLGTPKFDNHQIDGCFGAVCRGERYT